jgi:putative dimethyl sulfoxide reductase chaperone
MTLSSPRKTPAADFDGAVNLARLRRESYRLLAAALLYPDETTIEAIPILAAALRQDSDLAARMSFFVPWDRFVAKAETLGPADLSALEQSYLPLFMGTSVQRPVPLHETSFLDPESEMSGQVLADIEGAYGAAGLAASSSAGEMPDHVAVELEFVSYLIGGEEGGWEAGELSQVQRSIRTQRRFLQRHPCTWLPVVAREVASRQPEGFYAAATAAAWAMTAHDVDFLPVLLDTIRSAIGAR